MILPLVSIIIPVFNNADTLAETIQSALQQTWSNKELIIIDDGSEDNSSAIAKSFGNNRIKVFHQENKGASAARNYGLQQAKGDYIQFLDADDLLAPNKIASQMFFIKDKVDVLAICPVIHFNSSQRNNLDKLRPDKFELQFYHNSNNPFEFLLNLYEGKNDKGSMIPIHSWLTPISTIKKAGTWNEKLTINDDGEFFCRVSLQSKQIVAARQTACYYRKYLTNLSLSAGKDKKSIESQYHSIALRKYHLKKFKQDERIDQITVRGLMELLMITYPQHKKLSNRILSEIKQYKLPASPPPIGGKTIENIKKIFGWKIARLLQYYYANIFRNHQFSRK